MSFRLDFGWMVAALLLSLRVTAATLVAPVFGPMRLPGSVRVILSLSLAMVLMPVLVPAPVVLDNLGLLLGAGVTEVIVGASLGFGFLVAYGATQIAGRVLDVQLGFGVASILNPATQTLAPLLGSLFGMVLIAVFLAMDGHHVLIQALALSAVQIPPGTTLESIDFEGLFLHSALMFTYAVALAGPVMLTLLLIDLAMAVISRSMPQLNVFVLSFTLKIVVGLSLLAASIPLAGQVYRSLVESVFRFWADGGG